MWVIDPDTRSANVYASPDELTHVDENGLLSGVEVLPGFKLSLRELFAEADRQGPRETRES